MLFRSINEVIITGESMKGLLPEGSDVDVTIKIDRSQLMKFTAYFPLLDHTEELEIDIKKTEPPTEEALKEEIAKAKQTAKDINANDVYQKMEYFESQLENEKGSEDGKMKILDGLRKELLNLDSAERAVEWPKVEQELKDIFYQLEDLVEKIKVNGHTSNIDMNRVEGIVKEYKQNIEQVISDKKIKEAKSLIREIGSFDYNLRNEVTSNAMDINYLKHIENSFNSYNWKDRNKARQLCNQGLQNIAAGNTAAVRPILVELITLMPEDEKPKDTLG